MLKKSNTHKITYIHQILIQEGKKPVAKLPKLIDFNSREARRLHPGAEYILWDNDKISQFLKENFDAPVYETYKNITAFAYKADLARYCILYVMGGMYIDLGIRMMNFWGIPKEKGFSTFKELCFTAESWTIMQNGLIWSLPKRRELEICIEWIVKNYNNKFYGTTPLCPTGPVMYGRAIAAAMVEQGQSLTADDQWIGEYRWTTPEGGMKNDAYVSPDHKIIAFRTKLVPGDLSHLGLSGTNNYKEIWLSRQMYGEKTSLFSFKDERVKFNNVQKIENGFLISPGTKGVIIYGPYIKLFSGRYKLRVLFGDHSKSGNVVVDVTTGGGAHHAASRIINSSTIKNNNFEEIPFELYENSTLVEFVIAVDENFSGTIIGFELEKLDESTTREPINNEESCKDLSALSHKTTWTADDAAIKIISGQRSHKGITISKGTKGRVTYGPYFFVAKGKYVFSINFSKKTKFSRILIDIAYGNGKKIISEFKEKHLFSSHKDFISFPVDVNFDVDDMEFRVHVYGDFDGDIEKFSLLPR
ncbi:glycosyltransferase family 32 protein [Gluconobacter oxydans]|uniref:glycosyltransferase family 32 protein n=2 Tax=Gluconobacter oxydans TaxID=442 RepID=UPI0039ED964A